MIKEVLDIGLLESLTDPIKKPLFLEDKPQKTKAEIDTILLALKMNIGFFQVTGSLLLVEYGVINRGVNDIDIYIKNWEQLENITDVEYDDDYYDMDEGTPEPTEDTEMATFEFLDMKVNAFLGYKEEYIEVKGFGFKIQYTHPRYSIEAKENFIQGTLHTYRNRELSSEQVQYLLKHNEDISIYRLWLKNNYYQ